MLGRTDSRARMVLIMLAFVLVAGAASVRLGQWQLVEGPVLSAQYDAAKGRIAVTLADYDGDEQTLHIGTLDLPATGNSIADLMRVQGPRELALHVYQLLLVRDSEVFEYATIMETHHPDYLSTGDLYELYEYDTTNALPQRNADELSGLILGREF